MLVLDKPYVSEFLLRCAEEHELPVLRTPVAERLANGHALRFVESGFATATERVLTTSENALPLVAASRPDSELVAQVERFKDKLAFRRVTAPLHPDIEFRRGNLLALEFEDASIAGVVAFYAIVHFTKEQVEMCFREVFRVLQPGGVLLLTYHIGEMPARIPESIVPMIKSFGLFRYIIGNIVTPEKTLCLDVFIPNGSVENIVF